MKDITELKQLLEKIATWIETDIPDKRVNDLDSNGRKWFAKSVGYGDQFILKDLKEFTDRQALNKEYVTRFKEKQVAPRKGISAYKIEISALYSFNKCFVQRYKGRLHAYRDDLSQKAARTNRIIGAAKGNFEYFKSNLDQPNGSPG